MPMVRYWKTSDHTLAKLTEVDGATVMVLEGEDHPIYGFPRGHLLVPDGVKHGPFSILKHEIKNQIFNESWWKLEKGLSREQVIQEAKQAINQVLEYAKPLEYDFMPPSKMCPSVREIHRAWTKITDNPKALKLRDILCLILQADDGYRYRVQWLAGWFPFIKWFPIRAIDKGLQMVEHAEVVGDMKGRIRLLRRVVLLLLEDPKIRDMYKAFFKEVNWRKVRLSAGDKYHFRGKYFKVDMDVIEY